jgi:hypothetical protein
VKLSDQVYFTACSGIFVAGGLEFSGFSVEIALGGLLDSICIFSAMG